MSSLEQKKADQIEKDDHLDDDAFMDFYEDESIKKEDKSKEKSLTYEILTFIRDLVIILIVFWFITTFIGEKTSVLGDSMEPHIHDGDAILLSKVNYYFNDPQRYDIIVFPYNNGEANYIKRIIGLPGETIDLRAEGDYYKVYINDQPLEEKYGIEEIRVIGNQSFPLTIPTNEYFVMGDNRNDSSDSRYQDVGTVNEEDILGKAWLRIWPLKLWGVVK